MKTTLKTETGKSVIVENGYIYIDGMKPSQIIYLTGCYDAFPLNERQSNMIKHAGFDSDDYMNVRGTILLRSIYEEAKRQFDKLLETAMTAKIKSIEIRIGCDIANSVRFTYDLPEGFPERYRNFRLHSKQTKDLENSIFIALSVLTEYAKKCNIHPEKDESMYYDVYIFNAEQVANVIQIASAKFSSSDAYLDLLGLAKRTGVIQKREISSYELPNEGGYVVVYLNVTPDGKCYETHENMQ